jgi:glycosyltransferase involved in cell wall biosynthesis
VDDGSTDNTKEIVKAIIEENSQTKIEYVYQVNSERGAARNTGIKLAKGEYITFLDSDDILYSNHLNRALETIDENNKPDVFHLIFEFLNYNGESLSVKSIRENQINEKLIEGNFMGCHAVFLKKEVALQNLFIEDRALAAFEDWELWLRIACKYRFYYNKKSITSALINHDGRSVLNTKEIELVTRVNTLLKYVLSNKDITTYYKHDLHKFKSSCFSYVSLHLALTKKYRKTAVKFLIKSIVISPSFIFKKRFFAILKHIL